MSHQLLKAPEYPTLVKLLSGQGDGTAGISNLEVQHLSWLGSQLKDGEDYVEIGSHRGKSICAVGCGVRVSGASRVRLFGVDLWEMGAGKTYAHYSSEETFRIFTSQVDSVELSGLVHAVQSDSVSASLRRRRPIHLLFIDADHSYTGVKTDYTAWSPFVPIGGRIAFHDYKTRFRGVTKLVDEVFATREWGDVDIVDRIWSARRVALSGSK